MSEFDYGKIYSQISDKDIEDMLYQISVYATQAEAQRFHRLEKKKKQIVTYILKRRAKRARGASKPFDFFIVREVIDDAIRDMSHLSL